LDQKIEATPLVADAREHHLKRTGLAYIARNNDRTSELLCERVHERFGLRIQIGRRKFRTGAVKYFGIAKGYAVPIRDTDDQTHFVFQHHISFRPWADHPQQLQI
jgi:hypothetical protein